MTDNQIYVAVVGFLSSGVTLAVCKGFLKSQVLDILGPVLEEKAKIQLQRCELRQTNVDQEFSNINNNYIKENNRLNESVIKLGDKVDQLILTILAQKQQ